MQSVKAVVAEWLRRLTRNQIPSGSVGSSPTDREMEHFFVPSVLNSKAVFTYIVSETKKYFSVVAIFENNR